MAGVSLVALLGVKISLTPSLVLVFSSALLLSVFLFSLQMQSSVAMALSFFSLLPKQNLLIQGENREITVTFAATALLRRRFERHYSNGTTRLMTWRFRDATFPSTTRFGLPVRHTVVYRRTVRPALHSATLVFHLRRSVADFELPSTRDAGFSRGCFANPSEPKSAFY